jgi:CBS domain-containing protein
VLKAKDIMTTGVVTIQGSAMVAEAIGAMKENKVHALIVKPDDGGKGYGIVTEGDIAYKIIAKGVDPKLLNVRDIMTKPCITVSPDLSVENVARLFANNHIHRAPVVDNDLVGIVSVSDVAQRGKWWE